MNSITFPKFKSYSNQPVKYIQAKLDGHLTKIYTYNPRVVALTKNDKDITDKLLAIKHIRQVIEKIPRDSVIFAELHYPDGFSTDVPTMLNNADERLQLTTFATPMFDGEDLADAGLSGLMLLWQDCALCPPYTITLNQPKIIGAEYQEKLLTQAIEGKLEGWVLKEGHMTGWYKLKPVKELDAFVTGTSQSFSSQHYGGLKSIDIGIYANEFKIYDLGQVGSGFTAEYRASLNTKEKRDTLISRVCQVEYDSIAANGKLRFPRFIRWRDDKNKEECIIEQIKD